MERRKIVKFQPLATIAEAKHEIRPGVTLAAIVEKAAPIFDDNSQGFPNIKIKICRSEAKLFLSTPEVEVMISLLQRVLAEAQRGHAECEQARVDSNPRMRLPEIAQSNITDQASVECITERRSGYDRRQNNRQSERRRRDDD